MEAEPETKEFHPELISRRGEVKLHGDIKGRVGFVAGERILAHILDRSLLQKTGPPNPALPSSGYYYARK